MIDKSDNDKPNVYTPLIRSVDRPVEATAVQDAPPTDSGHSKIGQKTEN